MLTLYFVFFEGGREVKKNLKNIFMFRKIQEIKLNTFCRNQDKSFELQGTSHIQLFNKNNQDFLAK
jgi:hypothetical protein